MKRLLTGLLAVLMIFSLLGCEGVPAEANAYIQAVAQLEEKGAVTLDVVLVTTTGVSGGKVTLTVDQELTYDNLNYKNTAVQLKETFRDSTDQNTYVEYWHDGVLYVEYGNGRFSGNVTKAEVAKRYVPLGLFEAKRYRTVLKEEKESETVIYFSNAKSAESWAVPSGAKVIRAAGSATLSKDGTLLESTYTVTYQQGNAETTIDVFATPRQTNESFTVPTDTNQYTPLQNVDGPRAVTYALARMGNIQNVSVTVSETADRSYTGLSQNSQVMHLTEQDGKVLYSLSNITQSSSGVTRTDSVYRDGVMRVSTGAVQTGLTDRDVRQRASELLTDGIVPPEYWENVSITSLGGVLLAEITVAKEWGNAIKGELVKTSVVDYQVGELVAYVAINKQTGVPTGTGYKATATYKIATINGVSQTPKTAVKQVARAIEFPAAGAYKAITGEDLPEQEPEKKATPLFYKVTGKNGQQMWLLGTIHIGDERTAYLPKEIKDALAASDALALEMDADKFQQDMETDAKLQQQIREAYNYTDGSKTADHLNAAVYFRALQLMKASGNYIYGADSLKVAIWENTISNFHLQLGSSLVAEKGVEMRLTKWAKELNKPIWEVESGPIQIQMLTGWSEELQEFLMNNTLSMSPQMMAQSTEELYEMWCAGDEKGLRKTVGQSGKVNFLQQIFLKNYLPLLEEYNKGMNIDRNAHMLEVAKGYLESGDTVFYAVGLAHLLDSENGLVDTLREAGYTVERVAYSK